MNWNLEPGGDPPAPAPPLRPVPLKPGQHPPMIDATRECYQLTGGGPYRLTLHGTQAASVVVMGGEKPVTGGESGLEFLDGSEWVTVRGVRATRNQHGIRFCGCRNFIVEDCEAWANEIEGFIWGACHDHAVVRCVSRDNGTVGSHAPDRCHGFYPGYHSSGLRFSLCTATGNRGLGWHCNGTVGDGPAVPLTGLSLVSCVARGNGSGGSGNLDLSYTRGALILGCLLADGRGGLSTFDDVAGDPTKGAKGVAIRQSTIVSDRWALRLESGGVVSVEASIIAGPVSVDRTSRLTVDAASRRGTVAQAAEWLESGTFRSLLPGVGWQG